MDVVVKNIFIEFLNNKGSVWQIAYRDWECILKFLDMSSGAIQHKVYDKYSSPRCAYWKSTLEKHSKRIFFATKVSFREPPHPRKCP